MSNISGLSVVANKQPIVATHMGTFDSSNLANTVSRYEKEAETHIKPKIIEQYQNKFVSAINENQTPIGCLVAPFGYGKTSTVISTWNYAIQKNILAIPPFSCSSIAEMGAAIASALSLHLSNIEPELAENVRIAYEDYLASSATQLARQDAVKYEIDFDTALRSIEDKIEQGYIHIEANSTNLLAFLEKAVSITRFAGFDGLLIIVDEFQQFLGNINKSIITSFRTLIWGLKTRHELPLGFLLTMDPDTEHNLSERAGDILHRIKENGLYLNFANVYDREFPRLLWNRYAEIFEYEIESKKIVDRSTLESIGQITERSDLSNGPRTIMDSFQHIATVYKERKRPYTPIDLINDFTSGILKFDGDRNIISSLVNELISYDYIKRSPNRLSTMKLIAAFPRGCPREVAKKYKLENDFDLLADELRGEVLTELPEGIALVDLQRVGKPQNKLKIILKKYWLQITEQELIIDKATKLFAQHVIAPLFPKYKNVLTGWRELNPEFTLTPFGGYIQIYEGSFFREFPLRRVAVQVCQSMEQATSVPVDVDINLVCLLEFEKDKISSSTFYEEQGLIILHIPINLQSTKSLPRDIRWIEDYLRPVALTPGVLLSLIDYIEEQTPQIQDISVTELLRIQDNLGKLQEYLHVTLFGQELLGGIGVSLMSRGEQAIREMLFYVLRRNYPNYETMISSVNWDDMLLAYENALASLPITQRRGLENFQASKATLALSFGYHKHAGFKSQIQQLNRLVNITAWQGSEGALQFRKHPGEDLLQEMIILHGSLKLEELEETGRKVGYLPNEVAYLLKFLKLRGFIQYEEQSDKYIPAESLSEEELAILIHTLQYEIKIVQTLNKFNIYDRYQKIDDTLESLLSNNIDKEELQVHLLKIQNDLNDARIELQSQLREQLEDARGKLYKFITRLNQPLPLSQTGLNLDAHINGAQRTLTRKNQKFIKQLEKTIEDIMAMLQQLTELTSMKTKALGVFLTHYSKILVQTEKQETNYKQLLENIFTHSNWVKQVDHLKRLLDYINIIREITDTNLLQNSLEDEIEKIELEFSTIGLEQYQRIFDDHFENVEQISKDIELAMKAIEINQNKKHININSNSQIRLNRTPFVALDEEIRDKPWLHEFVNNEWTNLSDLADNGYSIADITDKLVELCKITDMDVQIRLLPKNR